MYISPMICADDGIQLLRLLRFDYMYTFNVFMIYARLKVKVFSLSFLKFNIKRPHICLFLTKRVSKKNHWRVSHLYNKYMYQPETSSFFFFF